MVYQIDFLQYPTLEPNAIRKHTRVKENLSSGTLGVIRSVMIEKMGTEPPILSIPESQKIGPERWG